MKNIYKTIFAGAALLAVNIANGQEAAEQSGRTLDRQVDVTSEYRPDVAHASKLGMSPDMTDTVALRPSFEYTITPHAWMTGFGVAAINPVRLTASEYNPLYPFYFKLGGGWPAQSLADVYIASTREGDNGITFYLNHKGRYGDIETDLGRKLDGRTMTNSAGIAGKVKIGERLFFEGEVGFDYDVYSRYGKFAWGGETLDEKVTKQHYQTPRARISIGNDFSDMSRFNFRLVADGALFSDKYDNKETDVKIYAEGGRMFDVHRITLRAGFDGYYGSDALNKYDNTQIYAAPGYGIITEKFKLEAEAALMMDMQSGYDHRPWILPQANITFNVSNGGIVPFATLESRMVNNGFRSLAMRNPYVRVLPMANAALAADAFDGGRSLPRSNAQYDLRAGLQGVVASKFLYKVYGGYTLAKSHVFFSNSFDRAGESSSEFNIEKERRMTYFTAGAEFEARLPMGLSAGISARYYNYTLKTFDRPSGMPELEGSLFVNYNYRDRFFLKATASLMGKRWWIVREEAYTDGGGTDMPAVYNYEKLDPSFDISLEAEYRLNRSLGIFIQGNNLANQELYYFNHYPDVGINFAGGVKLMF